MPNMRWKTCFASDYLIRSKWKSIDIQRINPQDDDYIRISSYLGKQTNLQLIALDPFNSDLSLQSK